MRELYSTRLTIEDFKGTNAFDIDICGYLTTGGSNKHFSDEPAWIACEIEGIYNAETGKEVSKRLCNYLIQLYGSWFEEELCDEYEKR